jgi:hypothetical protein
MSKSTNAFADDAITPATTPKISNTPMITGTGSVYWNVRDIVFGPNRAPSGGESTADHSESPRRK